MKDKTKRKISETSHYKLIRISYLDFGYMDRHRFIYYHIVDKTTELIVAMFSNLKLARVELKRLEDKIK